MQIRQWRVLAAACVIAVLTTALTAAGARFWQVSTQADFLKGDVQNLSVDQYGRLTLGPALTPVGESTTPFLWTLVAAADGGVYAGSGNDGQVFRFAPDGARTVFFDAAELEVHALAPAPGGGLFVGTSPAGKIYRVDAKGQSTVYFDCEDKYHLVAGAGSLRSALCSDRRERADLQDHRRRQGRRLLPHEGHARHHAAHRQERRSAGGHGVARQGLPDQEGRDGLRPARSRHRRDQCAPPGCIGHCVCRRTHRAGPGLEPSRPDRPRHVGHDDVGRGPIGLHGDHVGDHRGRHPRRR